MILRKSREFTINMGNYESVKIGASVEIDPDEIGKDIDSQSFLDDRLDQVLAEDIAEASALTNTRDSFILSWGKK